MPTETFDFQVEARQLLQLMIHSIYSNKDVFLRELISNASDALDKVRLESLRDDTLDADVSDPHIAIEADREARTLTVRDNGIGMSYEEVVRLIGTIANSGTAQYLREMERSGEAAAAELIGQFGVGFYASFMVADEVTLVTRRAGESKGTRWSSSGAGTYTIDVLDEAPQGTAVTLRLKPADAEDRLHDYTDPWKIREIVKRYSDFITWPVRMAGPATAGESATEDTAGGDGAEDGSKREPEVLNSMKALWARPRDEVSDAEYHELYKHISHDWSDPLETIRLQAEGTFEYQALLFIPAHAPQDLFTQGYQRGVQLYVKRVFIMADCEELLPSYLRFVKGVVDAQDLSLNVSREILQQDRHIRLMHRRLAKKVLSAVKDLMAGSPERYAAFWREFGRVVKEGLLSETEDRDAILAVCSFASTHDALSGRGARDAEDAQWTGDSPESGEAPEPEAGADSEAAPQVPETQDPVTLRRYVERMREGQQDIYYLTGESREAIESSPHMEAFRARDIEVLLLTDPVDEVWVEAVPEFDGHRLVSIAKGEVELGTDEERQEAASEREQRRQEYTDLLAWMAGVLTEQVKEVRLSSRLTTSPACVVSDTHDASPALEAMYRAMGQEVPRTRRILELNPDHALVTGLRAAHADRPAEPAVAETAELLYQLALLAEGGEPTDRTRFITLVTDRLERTL